MYFKLNNKLLNVKNYNQYKNILKKILHDDIYILINNKHYTSINNETFCNLPLINEISINYKIKGGFIDKIVEALIGIYKVFLLLLKLVLWLIQFAIWVIRFVIYIISLVFNILTSGIFNATKYIIYLLIFEPIKAIISLIKKIFSFGIKKDGKYDNIMFKNKCFRPKDNGTIPTTILVSTILCPPLGMFMMYGMTGWIKIIISTFLTITYYIPGLIYTLIDFYA